MDCSSPKKRREQNRRPGKAGFQQFNPAPNFSYQGLNGIPQFYFLRSQKGKSLYLKDSISNIGSYIAKGSIFAKALDIRAYTR